MSLLQNKKRPFYKIENEKQSLYKMKMKNGHCAKYKNEKLSFKKK